MYDGMDYIYPTARADEDEVDASSGASSLYDWTSVGSPAPPGGWVVRATVGRPGRCSHASMNSRMRGVHLCEDKHSTHDLNDVHARSSFVTLLSCVEQAGEDSSSSGKATTGYDCRSKQLESRGQFQAG